MDIETVQKAWAEAVDEQGVLHELIVVFAEKIADIERNACAKFVREYGSGTDKFGEYVLLNNGVIADSMLAERSNA